MPANNEKLEVDTTVAQARSTLNKASQRVSWICTRVQEGCSVCRYLWFPVNRQPLKAQRTGCVDLLANQGLEWITGAEIHRKPADTAAPQNWSLAQVFPPETRLQSRGSACTLSSHSPCWSLRAVQGVSVWAGEGRGRESVEDNSWILSMESWKTQCLGTANHFWTMHCSDLCITCTCVYVCVFVYHLLLARSALTPPPLVAAPSAVAAGPGRGSSATRKREDQSNHVSKGLTLKYAKTKFTVSMCTCLFAHTTHTHTQKERDTEREKHTHTHTHTHKRHTQAGRFRQSSEMKH